jgi:hypothetical protein
MNAPNRGNRHGGVGDRFRRGEFATVISYQADTYTANVRTENGRPLTGVPRLRTSPGDVTALEPGTEVLITHEYGEPLILGIVSIPGKTVSAARFSATDVQGFGGQGLNKSQTLTEGNYRQPAEPDDIAPGDWAHVGSDGNLVAVLGGGVNVLKSSALAQIRTHLINDLVEVISRNYRHVSDMGEFTIQNNDGRINMRFRGGTDQRSEAGPDEENWTVKFDLGSEGDMLNLELCTPLGQTLFKFHVNADGQCEIYGINGVSINSGSQSGTPSVEQSTGSKRREIGGDQTVVIQGDKRTTVGGNESTETSADHTVSAGNDLRNQALRDLALGCGRNMYVQATGDGLNDALTFDIEHGSWVVDIGGPTSLNPLSGFSMKTFSGDMTFESTLGGNFKVTTLLGNLETSTLKTIINTNFMPDSVILGGNVLASHIVKYEQLEQHLRLLYQLLDTHIHIESGTSVAAGIPVTGTSGPPVLPISPILSPTLLTFKSLTTGVSL